jgi:hypothetical protein
MAYTVNYAPTSGAIGWQGISVTSDVQKHPLGSRIRAVDTGAAAYGEGEFIYLLGVASTAIGSVVKYNADDFSTSLLAANDIGPVAVAMSANVASSYGWYQIYGKGVAKVATGFADNGLVYATATAGTVDDAVVSGDRVKNMLGASAIATPAAGLAEMEMQYPFMDDATAA